MRRSGDEMMLKISTFLFLTSVFSLLGFHSKAHAVLGPRSFFFPLAYTVHSCVFLKETRGRLEPDNSPSLHSPQNPRKTAREVCVLDVRCQSHPKLNSKARGPELYTKAYCFPNQANVCPSAQTCYDDREFKSADIKDVVLPKAKKGPGPARKSAQ